MSDLQRLMQILVIADWEGASVRVFDPTGNLSGEFISMSCESALAQLGAKLDEERSDEPAPVRWEPFEGKKDTPRRPGAYTAPDPGPRINIDDLLKDTHIRIEFMPLEPCPFCGSETSSDDMRCPTCHEYIRCWI